MTCRPRFVVAVLLAVLMTACGGSDDVEDATLEPTTLPSTTADASTAASSTTTTPPPTIAPTVVAQSLFVALVQQACTLGPVPDPGGATAELLRNDQFLITDVDGEQLLLDAGARVVTAVEGRQAELPPAYTFGCDPQVFLGTSD